MRRLPITTALSAGLLACAGLALSACGPINRGLESVNQPVVSRTDYVLDVSGDALRSGASGEAAQVGAWFAAIGIGYGDRVSIDDPARSGDEGVGDAVSTLLARHGLLLDPATPVTEGAIPPGMVRVVVRRSTAGVPGCSNWHAKSQPDYSGSTMSNYGCATNSNLAAMIADPEDLVRGVASGGSDPRSVNKAIRAYRDTPSTAISGLKTESTKTGN